MFKHNPEKTIAKNSLLCFILLTILGLVAFHSKWLLFIGFALGAILSFFKFLNYSWIFRSVCRSGLLDRKWSVAGSFAAFSLNQLVTLAFLFWTYSLNIWTFAGLAAGVLLVPLAIMTAMAADVIGIAHFNI
jgi:hypothetical protein